jgi:TonB family protein
MFQLRQLSIRRPVSFSLLTLALCVAMFAAGAGAQEAPRDSGNPIKPPTIKPPTVRSQSSNSRVGASKRKRRHTRRARARVTTTKAAARSLAGKPREVKGVVDDSADSMPGNAATPPPTTTRKPRGPISGGVLNGRAISLPVPPYPPIAKAAKASGTVAVRVLIDEDGKVTEAQAVSGHALLRKAAEDAARTARFAPTQLSGQPVKVTGVITYNFDPQ